MSDLEKEDKRTTSSVEEESSLKKAKVEINQLSQNDLTQVDEHLPVETCSICFEESSEGNIIVPHGCTKCKDDAWTVCQSCNDSLLSRKCPMCRSEYAPLVFHLMPGAPFYVLADKNLSEEERTAILYKFGIVRHLVGRSDVIVWSKEKETLYFSIPEHFTSTSPSEESLYVIASIKMEAALIENSSTFFFNTHIWDQLEDTIESGEVQVGELVTLKEAQAYIISITKEKDHKLFTMMTPDDWSFILDPSPHDTSEALSNIRSSLFTQALQGITTPGQVDTKELTIEPTKEISDDPPKEE